jgi:hypothetical protein
MKDFTTNPQNVGYHVYDTVNKVWLDRVYASRTVANRWADKMNNEYGSYRYVVQQNF